MSKPLSKAAFSCLLRLTIQSIPRAELPPALVRRLVEDKLARLVMLPTPLRKHVDRLMCVQVTQKGLSVYQAERLRLGQAQSQRNPVDRDLPEDAAVRND